MHLIWKWFFILEYLVVERGVSFNFPLSQEKRDFLIKKLLAIRGKKTRKKFQSQHGMKKHLWCSNEILLLLMHLCTYFILNFLTTFSPSFEPLTPKSRIHLPHPAFYPLLPFRVSGKSCQILARLRVTTANLQNFDSY